METCNNYGWDHLYLLATITIANITIANININNKMVTTRNHDLFDWKIKQKTNHLTFGQFDHLVMYWTSQFEHIQFDYLLF